MTNVKRLCFLIFVVGAVTLGALFAPAQHKASKPDFAMPRQTAASALKAVNNILQSTPRKAHNFNTQLSLMENSIIYSLAQSALSADSLPAALRKLEKINSSPNLTADTRALLDILQAQIYMEIYSDNSYVYNERPNMAPGTPVPEDYRQWNRAQFLGRVSALVKSSLAQADTLQKMPLRDYRQLLKGYGDMSLTLYPTLLDFVGAKAIEYLGEFDDHMRLLGVHMLEQDIPAAPFAAAPVGEILDIYNMMVAHSRPGSPVRANWEIERTKYIAQHLFGQYESLLQAHYQAMYLKHAQEETSAAYLLAMSVPQAGTPAAKEYYGYLRDYLREFSTGPYLKGLLGRLSEMTALNIRVRTPSQVAPGVKFDIKVSNKNARQYELRVFDITSLQISLESTSVNIRDQKLPSPAMTIFKAHPAEDSIPFVDEQTFSCRLDKPGRYVILPYDSAGKLIYPYSADFISCSELSLGWQARMAWVADAATGQPLEGARVHYRPWSRREALRALEGKTDSLGALMLPPLSSGILQARMGRKDIYAPCVSYQEGHYKGPKTELAGEIYLPRALYHPGDSVEFALVAWNSRLGRAAVAPGEEFEAELYDANNQSAGTVKLKTDEWGRATGSFQIPESGLTGNFRIKAYQKSPYYPTAYRTFTVSDYKLPTFAVEARVVSRPASVDDEEDAVVEVTATTFAGFPVADAVAELSLQVTSGSWWRAQTSPVFFTTMEGTDAYGKARITIPAQVLASSPNPGGRFMAQVAVTSPDGETRQGACSFNLGKPYGLSVSVPDISKQYSVSGARISVERPAENARDIAVRYRVTRPDSSVATEGLLTMGEAPANLDKALCTLPPGRYSILVSPVDQSLAEPAQEETFIIYGGEGSPSPVDEPLWLPQHNLVADAQGRAPLTMGTDREGRWVLITLSDPLGQLSRWRWVRSAGGMETVPLELPDSMAQEGMLVNAVCVADLKSYRATCTVRPASSRQRVALAVETFRDKVTPGALETVTFRTIATEGAQARCALMASMVNKALDILQPNPWEAPRPATLHFRGGLSGFDLGSLSVSGWTDVNGFKLTVAQVPDLNLFGWHFFEKFGFGRSNRMLDAAPMMAKRATSDEGILFRDGDNYDPTEDDDDEGVDEAPAGGEQRKVQPADESCRPSEIPLAFFQPLLTTDSAGVASLTYRVPDANTTWLLRAVAYNASVLGADAEASVVASKPLMVTVNAPRFLRQGDKAVIAASLMNNTDSAATISATWEIVEPSTGRVLSRRDFHLEEIDPMGRATISGEYAANDILPGVIVRVRATCGNFTDGEQQLMPLLPSQQDVIESDQFFLGPRQHHFAMEIEARPAGSRTMLSFCENATWQVVSALPGLRQNNINSTLEATAALFSAGVAEGLMRANPEIVRALRRWSENPSDQALVSNLQKNEDLKNMLLSATPWVSEALSDTERLQRLCLLLDRAGNEKVMVKALNMLVKNEATGGGWRWTPNYDDPSLFVTYNTLLLLAELRDQSWLPADHRLEGMIERALGYIDKEAADDFRRDPWGDYILYAYVRSLYPEVKQPSASRRVSDAAVQAAIGQWRGKEIGSKAISALLLVRSGYKATAAQIVESLRQGATRSPQRGMWWPQLDRYARWWCYDRIGVTSLCLEAFAAADPGAIDDIDAIRQWLILQKANTDWGSSVITCETIAAILTTGTKWTTNARGTAVRVADTLLEMNAPDYAVGAFTTPITQLVQGPAQLVIDRQADYPSYGAVITLRRDDMEALHAKGCDDLSVGKTLSVLRNGAWEPDTAFVAGERVMTTLTLNVEADLDYVVIEDLRGASLEPVEQLPTPLWSEGLCFYRENRDSQTNIFIRRLPRGVYMLRYELFATVGGEYSSGVAQVQSHYNPLVSAHSAGGHITVKP